MVLSSLQSTSLVNLLCMLRYCTVSLEVHYVTRVLLDPSTITRVETVAQVVHQVCLFSCRLSS